MCLECYRCGARKSRGSRKWPTWALGRTSRQDLARTLLADALGASDDVEGLVLDILHEKHALIASDLLVERGANGETELPVLVLAQWLTETSRLALGGLTSSGV